MGSTATHMASTAKPVSHVWSGGIDNLRVSDPLWSGASMCLAGVI